MMQTHDEKCLQIVLKDIFELLSISDENFQSSLHYYCQDENKLAKIQVISDYASNTSNIMKPRTSATTPEEMENIMTKTGAL